MHGAKDDGVGQADQEAAVTVEEARKEFSNGLIEGTVCPVCDRSGKLHRRQLNERLAKILMWMDGVAGSKVSDAEGWIHMARSAPRWITSSNQHSLLAWWGLTEPGDRSGVYRITSLGRQWVDGNVGVRRWVWSFNARPVKSDVDLSTGEDNPMIKIRDCFRSADEYRSCDRVRQISKGQGLPSKQLPLEALTVAAS